MYLVELRPGKEELYRTSEDLALAIRNGDVDARSRVYHRATAKWISITLHPQYKAIVAASKEDPARPTRRGWAILGGGGQAAESSDGTPSTGQVLHRWRRPLALGLSGLLLVSGIQLAFSGPRPPWAGHARVAATRVTRVERTAKEQPVQREMPELVALASTTTVWPEADQPVTHDLPMPAVTPASRRALPRAPRLGPRSLREALAPGANQSQDASSIEALLARYAAAYDSARAKLEAGVRVARLNRLFATPRLSASGGVADTRMSLAGATNFIRIFRVEQGTIEAAYQDSVVQLAKQHGWSRKKIREWYARPSRQESPTLALLSGSLLATIDSVLGVLDAQAGAYKIRGTAIAFEDPTAGQTYGALRRRIQDQVDAAVAAGGATSAGPTGLLLRAIGTTTLPRET